MQNTLIPAYKSREYERLDTMFRLLTDCKQGEISELIPLITKLEISQFYLVTPGKQLSGEPEIVSLFGKIKKEILVNNLYYLNHAGRLLGRLKEKKIECIVLKGLSFISHLYNDKGLRPFCDLDLLIRRDDAYGFLEVAEQEGFVLKCEVKDPSNTDDFDIYHTETKVKVDILTTLTGGYYFGRYFSLDDSHIWERRKPVKIQDTETYRLSEEDELIYSIIHLAFHLNFQVEIKWLFDLRYLLEKYGESMDTKYLSEQIRKAGLERVIETVTGILSWMFETDYSTVFGLVKSRFSFFDKTWLRFYAYPPRLFGTCLEFPGVVNRMSITFMKYALISSPKKKWKFIADRIFPDTGRITFAYKAKFSVPLKFYFPMIRMLFFFLSPILLTGIVLIFLGSTGVAKLILSKHTYYHG